MLRLKKLELIGFKSFCDRQELRFNGDGIAAIVGPNGCGKSNIGDSISWVLGERSAKSLRGGSMQDVIFNGSRDRKPSGMATVSITLLDPNAHLSRLHGTSNGHAANGHSTNPHAANGVNGTSGVNGSNGNGIVYPVDSHGEITVSRKLFRSGESDYLINGKSCRLRDIQDLFMGTGLGPEHYAIIEQGRIGQILSSRPLDRRAFLEEAAGVTKFKARKRLAELKLESARQNLNRVNDILQEVTRQVGSLKRQAARARRYEELKAQLIEKLSLVLANRYREIDEKVRAAQSEIEAANEQVRDSAAKTHEIEAELGETRRRQQQQEHDLESGRAELSQLTVETERLQSRIEQQAQMAGENLRRKTQAEAEIAHLAERLTQLEAELAAIESSTAEITATSDETRRRLDDKSAQLEQHSQELRASEEQQERSRQDVIRLLGEVSSLRNKLAQMDEFLAGNERQAARAREEEAAVAAESAEVERRRAEIEQQIDSLQTAADALAARRREIEEQLAALREEAQTRRRAADQIRTELSRLTARRDSLEEILSHHAYTTETVKNLFAAIQREPLENFKPIGILADYIEVDPKHERATEEFLREELEYVVVANWDEARQGVQLVRNDLQGYVTFLVHPESPVQAEIPALGPETGVVGRLADAIRLTNGLSGSASTLLPSLRGCYLVEDENVAKRLAVQYPDQFFLLPGGVCYRGYTVSGGKKDTAGPLTLKRELRELGPRIATLEANLESETSGAERAEAEIAARYSELEAAKSEQQETEKQLLALDHQLRQLNDHRERNTRRLTVTRAEIERLGQEAARTNEQRAASQAAIEQREAEQAEAEQALATLREQIAAGQARRAALAEEQTGLRTALAALEERLKSALAALDRMKREIAEHTSRRDHIANQIGQWETQRAQLLANNVELEAEIASRKARRAELETALATLAADLEASRQRVETLEQTVREKREELDALRERRSAIELHLVEVRSDAKRLEETSLRDLNKPIAELALPGGEPLTAEQLDEAQREYESVRTKIENLGPVNILALEEYEEAHQREEFLETQRTDLIDSIRDTQQAIAEIDNVSKKKFEEAFEAINIHFRELFKTLFGGGLGEMRLTDESNPGESGVDIVASPPGKRLQNVALLSGGEKSLTALALLMATFKYKPSPFCVLDEVDAALDEANIRRFRRLIQEMAGTTQFIVITHSKTTMEAAQSLYGVTMQEPGVSKLVSVRMHEGATPPPAQAREAVGAGV